MRFPNLTHSILLVIIIFTSCKNDKPTITDQKVDNLQKDTLKTLSEPISKDTSDYKQPHIVSDPKKTEETKYDASLWSELTQDDGFVLDIRYATTNNFTKKQIYDCGKCFMRPEAAEKLKTIRAELKEKFGYDIKIFDCYRPGPYQQRLWDIVPNPDYVTPPHKGSMHSKGLAIDLTLVDKEGNELDMGTAFDFFGPEAHQGYNHSDAVKRHRWILRSTMEKHGFGSIRTEWWHFSYKGKSYPLDKWVWNCEG
jgi:zinc D-Ala-D-Ala dipeptidase